MKTKKTFDCIAMKRRGAEEVQQTIAGMTLAEELAYWQSGTEALGQRQKQLRAIGDIETMSLSKIAPAHRSVQS